MKRIWMGALAALALCPPAQAAGPSVSVSVDPGNGVVTVTPASVSVAATDTTITWTLAVKTYRFASGGGVSVPSAAGYSCTNAADNASVTCTRSMRKPGHFSYSLNLVPLGSSAPAQPPSDIWIQDS